MPLFSSLQFPEMQQLHIAQSSSLSLFSRYFMEDHLLEGLSSPLYLVPQITQELLAREQVPAVK